MADSLLRQWKILRCIPRAPRRIKIAELIEQLRQYDVDVPTHRTVQRDLDVLANIFPMLKSAKQGSAHYWFMDTEKEVLDIPRMESPTALAFYLAEQQLCNELPTSALDHLQAHFNTARKILDKHPSVYSDWRNNIRVMPQTQKLLAPAIPTDVLDTIYTALLEKRRFEAKYYGRRDDQFKHYRVNPLALIFRGTVTYLVCTLRDYQDIRLLSLHRFVEAVLTDVPTNVPPGFDLDTYIQQGHVDFRLGELIKLEMLIHEEVVIHLQESKLSKEQRISWISDQHYYFQATVQDTGQLRWWLLGFADHIEILKPEALRQEFKEKTARMAQKYQD